nr:CDP-glucose 4,6-dehydratase [Ammoniphilus resinae]
MIDPEFWKGKKVLVTGHTGFKGSWLCLWLHALGASVTGYSLGAPTEPNLYQLCRLDELVSSHLADIRNFDRLSTVLQAAAPDLVFHLAAQPLVRQSYRDPLESYETNIMGTVHLLEAVRRATQKGNPIKAVINVTSDKCYENQEWVWGYRETDPLGGKDPYSNSKACAELVTACYREAFFEGSDHPVTLATVRAGNVIGGGDWAKDRLIPDLIRSTLEETPLKIRYPKAVRPWQHVLEPLHGYLLLAQKLADEGPSFAEAWNFGPEEQDVWTVEQVVKGLCEKWGRKASYEMEEENQPLEARSLKLDSSKAKQRLGWQPKWNLDTALTKVVEWVMAYQNKEDLRMICLKQIEDFVKGGRIQ